MAIALAVLDLGVEVLGQCLEKYCVVPAAFGIEQFEAVEVLGGVNTTADQLLGLGEKARFAGNTMAVEQGVDRIAGASAGAVVERITRRAGQTGGAAGQPAEDRTTAVVDVDDPLGRVDRRLPASADRR